MHTDSEEVTVTISTRHSSPPPPPQVKKTTKDVLANGVNALGRARSGISESRPALNAFFFISVEASLRLKRLHRFKYRVIAHWKNIFCDFVEESG
ncbi:hypothetical protein NPIL_409221 [Nephila pilipes]|uniref:Uncharacterized protein n=1 Tax=Nephila pilipes TaxID=299642 RepID=A0A8X6QQN3_NEPPI|nr:hypothetical protein NPIL_409221 [Nephila pilipes]